MPTMVPCAISLEICARLCTPDSQQTAGTAKNPILTEQQHQHRDREMIIKALQEADGKVFGAGGAAEILGVKPTTLMSRMKRFGINKNAAKSGMSI